MKQSKLVIEIQDDGTIKTNATQVFGTEKEILDQLNALAKELDGELEVEEHVHSHDHSHSHDHHHKH
jgi:hypothetical protein